MKIYKKVSVGFVSLAFGLILPVAALAAGPEMVNMGSTTNFAILAKTAITTVGTTSIVGDVGISPAAASYITGFALNLPAAGTYATSSLVTGKVYAPGYADPTSTYMTVAINNMQNAYNDAAGKTLPTAVELGAGNIGGMTLAPGLYKWSTGVTIPTDVTLSGGANDTWIFQIAQNLTTSSATHVILSGGAQASNIFWQVAGQATLGTGSSFNGNILSQTAIVLNTGATLNGRALAQTAVTLDSNTITIPTASASTSGSTSTPVPLYTSSGSTTSVVAQSSTPVAVQVNSTTTVTTMSPGCSGGNKYDTATGVLCNNTAVATAKYDFGTTTLRNGSRGAAVKELQRFLNDKLSVGLKLDGIIGPKTIVIIRQWQTDHNLVADGLIGPKTKTQMNIEANN